MAGASSRDVLQLLERGAMTLESDLSENSARRLGDRLKAVGVPAEIMGDDGHTLDGLDMEDMLSSMGIDDIEVDDQIALPPRRQTAVGAPAGPTAAPSSPASENVDGNRGRTQLGTGYLPDSVRSVIEEERATASAPTAEAPLASASPTAPTEELKIDDAGSSGGWDAVFPGISGDQIAVVEASDDKPAPEVTPDDARTVVDQALPDRVREQIQADRGETPAPAGNNSGGWDELGIASGAPPKKTPTPPVKAPDDEPSNVANSAQPAGLGDAILRSTETRRPPYQPTGYDDRTPHDPGIAAWFSMMAPGAGQVFNGDDDEAMDYALRFWAITPWRESVRKARSRAQKINTYYAPRPPAGALLRALRFTLGFWFCILGTAGVLGLVGNKVVEIINQEDHSGFEESEILSAIEQAKQDGQEARIAALDALAEALQQQRARFTMSDEERAERLFRLGYQLCANNQLNECEATMRRVNELQGGRHRQAFRLQTWASVARASRGKVKTPIPDVGPVETLEEFELNQLREEEAKQSPEDTNP